jgi:hypothetical protein
MHRKRVLIVSEEAWRDEDNGGNVLSNLFGPLTDEFEFAQIYCRPAMPDNEVCLKYFHLSTVDMMKSVLFLKKYGYSFQYKRKETTPVTKLSDKTTRIWFKIKQFHWGIFYLTRDLLFCLSRWRTPELQDFILEFNPDIVFAPMYGSVYMHHIDRYVAKLTGKKLISYVSDDHLTYRHYSLSPIFWFNRWRLRKQIIKTSKSYSLLYTMTDEQKAEYEPILNVPMKILKKAKPFTTSNFQKELHTPIRLIYGGNLTCNRSQTLGAIRKALQVINSKEKVAELVIYTQSHISPDIHNQLHDGVNSFLLGKVSLDELTAQYSKSDILLHVESFDRKPRLQTRLSFSTKIIDLMHACRCIVAICWEESSPYKYLRKNNLAYCITSEKEIELSLKYLFEHPNLINDYANRAWEFGSSYHNIKLVENEIRADFKKQLESLK